MSSLVLCLERLRAGWTFSSIRSSPIFFDGGAVGFRVPPKTGLSFFSFLDPIATKIAQFRDVVDKLFQKFKYLLILWTGRL